MQGVRFRLPALAFAPHRLCRVARNLLRALNSLNSVIYAWRNFRMPTPRVRMVISTSATGS
jgi:hypothetical protein